MADNWHVVSQRQSQQLTPGGTGFQTVWTVTYQIDNGAAQGTVGSIVVPAAQYNADVVAAMITQQVAVTQQVGGL